MSREGTVGHNEATIRVGERHAFLAQSGFFTHIIDAVGADANPFPATDSLRYQAKNLVDSQSSRVTSIASVDDDVPDLDFLANLVQHLFQGETLFLCFGEYPARDSNSPGAG